MSKKIFTDENGKYMASLIKGLIAELDTDTIGGEGKVIVSVSEENGKINATASELTSKDKTITVDGLDMSVNIDNDTLIKGENGVVSVAPSASAISGEKSVKVTEVKVGEKVTGKKVSLSISTADKVLTQDDNGLLSNITLVYKDVKDYEEGDTTHKEIQLIGKDNTVISRIDATDFIKDGMLENAELKKSEGEDGTKTLLVLTFNTDGKKTPIELDVTELIDVYKTKENEQYIKIEGYEVSTTDTLANELRNAKTTLTEVAAPETSQTDVVASVVKVIGDNSKGDNYTITVHNAASKTDLDNTIKNLDKEEIKKDKEVIVSVKQADGIISATTLPITLEYTDASESANPKINLKLGEQTISYIEEIPFTNDEIDKWFEETT